MFHSIKNVRAACRLLVISWLACAPGGAAALLAADGMPNPLPDAVTDATGPAYSAGTSAGLLDTLEQQVDSLTSATDRGTIDRLESDAQDALRRSSNTMERIRARRVLRRISQRTGRDVTIHTASPIAAGSATGPASVSSGFARLAQYYVPSSTPTLPGEPPCPPLDLTVTPPPSVPVMGAPMAAPMAAPLMATPAAVLPPAPRHYVSLDALGFWVQGDKLPPLVTTSPVGTAQDVAGVLGQPNTTILYGDQTVNGNVRPGARIQGGVWFDPQQTFAGEGHYYALVTQDANYSQTSTFSGGAVTDPIIARPFFNIDPVVNAQDAILYAFPDFIVVLPPGIDLDGTIQVKESSRIQSAGGGGRYSLSPYGNPARFSLFGGYRFFSLVESLTISTSSTSADILFPIPVTGSINQFDQFSTKNTFNGGELGITGEFGIRRWYFSADGRLALGSMNQQLTIDGRTSAVSGGFEASYTGGLLAQPTNIGSISRNVFAMIPQVDAKLGFQVTQALRLTVGYNFTYITNVIRPGSSVDTTVNGTQFAGGALVGDARPAATFNDTSIWLQGVTAGVDLRF